MKLLSSTSNRRRERGWALLAVITLSCAAIMVLAGVMKWASENANVAGRNNEFFTTAYAAEAATEKVLASLSQQYQNYGFSVVTGNLPSYRTTYPTSSDDSYWTNFQFSGGSSANTTIVTNVTSSQTIVMGAPYTGLTLVANIYEIISNAKQVNSPNGIVATVGQKLYLGTIPLFQFAIFYQNDMEIAPGANMTVKGAVHSNGNIYYDPQDTLTFTGSTVSASGSNVLGKSPLDPSSRTLGNVVYSSIPTDDVNPLNLPVGTNTASVSSNMDENVYGILQPAQSGQTPNSSTGTNLLYNRADMIILISNNSITVTSGAGINSQATSIPDWSKFLSTNGSFYDQREGETVNPVVLNVSNLVNWSSTNTTLRPVLSSSRGSSLADVQSIYIADERSTSNATVTTNVAILGTNYTTNSVTTATYPLTGTYSPPVTTNTTSTTSSVRPTSGYVGTIMTNTTSTTSSTRPTTGTYTGTITTNSHPTSYTYNKITGYTYNAISSYTYGSIIQSLLTNLIYLTNWTVNSMPGIVLSNGAVLPSGGLSIATPDPAYIDGNWNIKQTATGSSDAGLADTTYTRPSAIYADAITVLSGNWNPNNSSSSLSSRTATSDTVNAAFLTGNVPSNGSYYSGGVENFPRFLENWSGQTFTYNGSMVAMFASQIADSPWPNTGTVYQPPTRSWAFDSNFNDPSKQPPMTPQVITVYRSGWQMLKPYTTSF